MSAVYPGTVRSFDTKIDLEMTVFALHVNDLQDEVVAIQNVLGTNPQGGATTPATVGKRVLDLENGKANTAHDHNSGAWVGLTTANHDVVVRHTFGAAYGNPATPTTLAVGGAAAVGTGDNPAKEDHTHGMPSAATLAASVIPAGTIVAYGGTSAPAGWVFCDGASYVRTAPYDVLFTAIGTRYGNADGTHFNVPELRSKFPMGAATTGAAVGTGGFADATLPSHNHSTSSITAANAGSHRHGYEHGHGFYDPGHIHNFGNRNPQTVYDGTDGILISRGDGTSTVVDYNRGSPNGRDLVTYAQILDNISNCSVNGTGPINTGWEVDSLNHGHLLTIAYDGISAINRNLPPYQTVNYIIKL